jgi:nitrite reductase/ring-hydroxylating ferredoxin subunit
MQNKNGAIRVASKNDLKEGAPLCISIEGKALALFQADGKFYATDNACAHAGGPLCEGSIKDGVVTCPWHGSQYKLETGEVLRGPAKKGVQAYPVEIHGDDLYVILDKTTDTKPKAVQFSFEPTLDRERPFSNEGFLNDLLKELKFPFKLYGALPFVVIAQSADEVDLYLGEMHITEMDFQKLSGIMKALNEKWNVAITYCIFHSVQFPGAMLLNIRGPHAPMNMENTIKF